MPARFSFERCPDIVSAVIKRAIFACDWKTPFQLPSGDKPVRGMREALFGSD
jgi:hypothetical protein